MPAGPLIVFCCYSHQDEKLREELEKHLKSLMRSRVISTWSDRKLVPGEVWRDTIDENLRRADIIMPLVSADFMASDYCQTVEMQQAMERHRAGNAVVIPVILRPALWRDGELGELQALPKEGKPITTWNNQDEAFLSVAEGIRLAAEHLQRRHSPDSAGAPPPIPPNRGGHISSRLEPPRDKVLSPPRSATPRWLLPAAGGVVALVLIGFAVTRFSRHDESAKTIEKPKTTLDTATKSQVDGHRDAVSDTATRPAVSPRHTHPTEPSNAKPPPSQIAENRPIQNTADPPPVAHSSAPAHSDQENVELAPRAMKIAESGDCKTALPLLETAVSANPSNVNLILVLGRCQNALGKFSEASQSLTSAIEMSGNRADLYAERAKSFFGRNQFRPALSDVDQALKYQPGNPAAVELRGDIFMQKGQYDDAVNAYYDVYQRAPTRGLCSKLAQAYLKNGAENSATRLEEACRQ